MLASTILVIDRCSYFASAQIATDSTTFKIIVDYMEQVCI